MGGYWLYPTRSDSQPGNIVGSSPNQTNYNNNGVYSVTQGSGAGTNDLSNVGAFSSSASAFGTYDQGGNVFEWNDAATGVNSGSILLLFAASLGTV